MSDALIIAGIVLVLIFIITMILFYVIRRTNILMKDVYADKLSEFDFLIEDKEKRVSELNENIKEKTEVVEKLKEESINNTPVSVKNTENEEVVLPMYADFEDGNLLENYKTIKKSFDFDVKSMLKSLIEQSSSDVNNSIEALKRIRAYFSYDVVYKLSSYNSSEQSTIVSELLSSDEMELVKEIFVKKNFNINKFVSDLDNMIRESDNEIKVYVGDKNLNFDYINKNIKTIYDERIMEGFKIEFKGIIYDYSI